MTAADKELLIVPTDRHYCAGCYYLVSIVSHTAAKYTLQAESVEDNYPSLLRVGETKLVKLTGNKSEQVFQFMLESKQ